MSGKFRAQPCSKCGSPQDVVDGAWLRDVRQAAGLSLREMARRAGFTAAYLCDIVDSRGSSRLP